MELIDGNAIAASIIAELKTEVSALPATAIRPCIAFVRVGEDPASISYVNKKNRTAAEIGMETRLELFPDDISQDDLFAKIDELNADDGVHGILVQAPLPRHMKDIDVFRRISSPMLSESRLLATIHLL